uniref:Uncharacterized protein n=1 Tax=Lactuca sativa TaxID=4236 RepID=A0A9R1VGI4_LACSA|nr:hypothetical protein LSAT_V11C500289380 [Lactuca sativa]
MESSGVSGSCDDVVNRRHREPMESLDRLYVVWDEEAEQKGLLTVGSGKNRRAKISSNVGHRIDTNSDDISPLGVSSLLPSIGTNPIHWIMFRTKGKD